MSGKIQMKVKEGHKEEFEKTVMEIAKLARGTLGWSGLARMMADLKVDHAIFGHKITGNARIRRKKYKRLLKQAMLSKLRDHVEVTRG